MSKKPLGTDSQGIQKVMRLPNYLGDGAAQFSLNAISGMVGIIVYFYTDKVGIAAATAGSILFIAKLFDAVTDLVLGWLVDHTHTRWGKARPWLLWMALPTFISIVALFLVPPHASQGAKFAYALVTNTMATAFIYTAVAIPFGSMLYFTTKSTEERSKMGVVRAIFGYVVGMVISIGYIPITNALGGDQRAWVIFAIVIGFLAGMGLIWSFFANVERTEDPGEEDPDKDVPFWTSINLLFHNKYWVIMLAVMAVVNVLYGITSASGIYYVKWVIGDENLMAVLGAIGLIPVVVGFAAVTPLVKRFGPTKTVKMALLVGIAGTIVRVIFPYDLWALFIFGPIVTLATIPIMAVGGVLVTNTISYGEWKYGRRLVGMANAASGFGGKIGTGLGSALIGWVLAWGMYNGTASVQPHSAIISILAITIWIPGILLVLLYVLLHFYDLDKRYPAIVKELEERKAKRQAARKSGAEA